MQRSRILERNSTSRLTREQRKPILQLAAGELTREAGRVLEEAGERPYRLDQLKDWLYHRTPANFSGMDNLPESLRERLNSRFVLHPLQLEVEHVSQDGTRKYLWTGGLGRRIESVLIPDGKRTTYCISTQVGCPVKCTFCATGYGGFQGQLSAAEIVDQLLLMRLHGGLPPTNVVFMGMGEPLLNFDAVSRALRILTDPGQLGYGARRITVSTVGIPARMRQLAKSFPQVKLALSLHAANDELRDELIPLNRKYPLRDVLQALRDHTVTTGKMATIEYVILPRINDARQDAEELCRSLGGIPCSINLLGFNPFPGAPYGKPDVRRLLCFQRWLGQTFPGRVTIRRSRGEDVQGACGQLTLARRNKTDEDPTGREQKKSPGLGERNPGPAVGRKEKS